MAGALIRNSDWEDDEQLKSDLQRYVKQNLRRREILDFVRRDFPEYAWSLGTLSRRLAFFGIQYIKYDTDIEVETALREEIEGPGQLLGYRAMHKKLREQHNLAIPRDLVHNVMGLVNPERLQRRGDVGKKKMTQGCNRYLYFTGATFFFLNFSKFTFRGIFNL